MVVKILGDNCYHHLVLKPLFSTSEGIERERATRRKTKKKVAGFASFQFSLLPFGRSFLFSSATKAPFTIPNSFFVLSLSLSLSLCQMSCFTSILISFSHQTFSLNLEHLVQLLNRNIGTYSRSLDSIVWK